MQHDSPRHTDEAYNRALIRLYRAAIEASLRAEQEQAEEEKEAEDAAPTTKPAAASSSEGLDQQGANQSHPREYTTR